MHTLRQLLGTSVQNVPVHLSPSIISGQVLGMKAAIDRYCTRCLEFQQNKHKNPVARAPLQHITATRPYQIIAMDFLGPLPRSNGGNLYIMAVIDYFTKWLELFPLRNIQTTTVADKLTTHIISRYGVPEQIHSDQGSQFESDLFQDLCRTLHIHKTRTTLYHPQCDGLVERSNRTVQNILEVYTNDTQSDWDKHLRTTMLAYNTRVHSTTGFTPYFLMFGREATLPLHLMYPLPQPHAPQPITTFVTDLQARLQTSFDTVRQHTDQHHKYSKDRYDLKATASQFNSKSRFCLATCSPTNSCLTETIQTLDRPLENHQLSF
eukprot:scpid75746/ scgid18439/ Retrovirus-related Pol polyprotein from transposon 412; Protease; Reverse transcriptase; Endonuclease